MTLVHIVAATLLFAEAIVLTLLVLKDVAEIPVSWLLLFAAMVGVDLVATAAVVGLV